VREGEEGSEGQGGGKRAVGAGCNGGGVSLIGCFLNAGVFSYRN